MTRVDLGGFALNLEIAGQGPPVALLHGFTGSAAGWSATIDALAPEFTVLAIDLVGHGRSDAPARLDHYRMERVAADLAALLRKAGYERATWLGYSMGGRTALQLAVHRPEVVSALVLEGASAGLAAGAERAERVRADEALADRIEREGIEAFVAYWEDIPLFATQSPQLRAAQRPGRLASSPVGLANSLRGMGAGAQSPLHERLGDVRVPVLLLVGASDIKFSAVAEELALALPDATMQRIEGAGHAAHLERPDAFNALVLNFLRRVHATAAI